MKKIILVRHAKSSWKNHELKDLERPLKKKGSIAAAMMATVLKEKQLSIDQVRSSPAVRALDTAKAIAQQTGIGESVVVIDQGLYLESKSKLLRLINELDDRLATVVLVGHNPGITDLSNLLTEDFIEWIPTAGMVGIEFDCNTWKEVEKKKGKQLFFEVPKDHRKKQKLEKDESQILQPGS